jgi:hypothetical protein
VTALRRAAEPLSDTKIPSIFTRMLKAIDEGAVHADDLLKDVKDLPETWRGLTNAYRIGGETALKKMRNMRGYDFRPARDISYEEFFRRLSEVDLDALASQSPDPQAFRKGMTRLFNQFDIATESSTHGFRASQGASHQLLDILSRVKLGRKVKGVEVDKDIFDAAGNPLGKRRYDAELGEPDELLDHKAWDPENIDTYLDFAMRSKRAGKAADGKIVLPSDVKEGQLFLDLVLMLRTNDPKNVKWVFDPRMAGKEAELAERILGLMQKGENKKKLMKALGIKNPDDFDDLIIRARQKLPEFISVSAY